MSNSPINFGAASILSGSNGFANPMNNFGGNLFGSMSAHQWVIDQVMQ